MKQTEIKIALVGDGGVGKTSIVGFLKHGKTPLEKNTTHGIEISELEIISTDGSIKANIWDFGGQEIYHAIHELFFTSNTIYLLVVDARQENEIHYWVQSISNLAGNVPIVIVINKTDLYPSFDLNRSLLTSQYPNIIGFVKVSCLLETGLDELKQILIQAIESLKINFIAIPPSWNRVKNTLELLNEDFIEYDKFKSICIDNEIVDNEAQHALSDFLHNQGAIVHFKNFSLYNTIVINPLWITEAAYLILNSNTAASKNGVVSYSDIENIFKAYSLKYISTKVQYIIRIIMEFELLLKIDSDVYIIPSLLKINEPNLEADFFNSLKLNFTYDFLPKNLFPKVICRLAKSLQAKHLWRNGLLMEINGSFGLVRKDEFTRQISIEVSGEQKKELLFIIRDVINNVNFSYPSIIIEVTIPIEQNGKKGIVKYSHLLAYQNRGDNLIFIPELNKEFDITSILNDIEPEKKALLNPIQIFISYSHKDTSFKDELISHIYPLVRLNEIKLWEDGKIIPGQEWEIEIMNKLNESDVILCLISSDFISSEFCYSIELNEALAFHERKQKVVIPIFVRACFWKKLPIAKIQGLPKIPISSHANKDEGWEEVVTGIDSSLSLIRDVKYGT